MLFTVVCGLVTAVAPLVAEHRLNSCGTRDLPGSGVKLTSPAMAGGFFTTEPPGEPPFLFDEVLTEEMNPTL